MSSLDVDAGYIGYAYRMPGKSLISLVDCRAVASDPGSGPNSRATNNQGLDSVGVSMVKTEIRLPAVMCEAATCTVG